MEIPLKKVTVAQVVKKYFRGLKLQIDGVDYIGTEYFFLKSDIATKGFNNKINALSEIKEVNGKTFEYLTDPGYYNCTDDDLNFTITEDKSVIILKTGIGYVGINYNYYSYFKKLGVKLYFNSMVRPIGMFKDNDFIGILLPVRIREEN